MPVSRAFSRRAAVLLVLALPFAPPASADVYKCRGDDGKVAYTDRPCPRGSAGEMVMMRGQRAERGDEQVSRECVGSARRIWSLQSREVGGELSADELRELQEGRNVLDSTCGMRLAASALAYRCSARQRDLTAATAAAADPKQAERLVRVQTDYNRECGDNLIDDDIRAHLRPTREPRREE